MANEKMKVYVLDDYTLSRLQKIADGLCSGTDRERDYGNALAYWLSEIRETEEEV